MFQTESVESKQPGLSVLFHCDVYDVTSQSKLDEIDVIPNVAGELGSA